MKVITRTRLTRLVTEIRLNFQLPEYVLYNQISHQSDDSLTLSLLLVIFYEQHHESTEHEKYNK